MSWCPNTESRNHTADCYQKQITCGNSDKDHKHTEACKEDVGPLCGGTP